MRLVAVSLLLATILVGQLRAQNPPTFKVAVHSGDGSVVLLVPASATDADLAGLVHAFRIARNGATLDSFLPRTTPRGSKGPYAVVEVFVMSDADWATASRLEAYTNPRGTLEAEKEFASRVRAYYLHSLAGQDFGSIGYEDKDIRYKTPNYKRLF